MLKRIRFTEEVFCFFTLILAVNFNSLFSQIVINEVYYNPNGTDTGKEWIEFFNTSASPVNMDGWEVDCDIAPDYTFNSFTLSQNSYVVIYLRKDGSDSQTELYTGTSWSSTNMGNSSGQIALYKSSFHTQANLVDYVEWGATGQTHESQAITVGQWIDPPDFAPLVSEGYSIEYDGSGNSGGDWVAQSTPTPGNDNSLPVFLTSFSASVTQNGILLRWSTASEVNNAGFYVCRSENSDGGFARISNLIPGAGNSDEAKTYRFVDRNVTAGETYYYQIEDVDMNGITVRHQTISIIYGTDGQTENTPHMFSISPSYPSPFGDKSGYSATSIKLNITKEIADNPFTIGIFNLLGQKVYQFARTRYQTGSYVLQWHGLDNRGNRLSAGPYFWVIHSKALHEVRRVMLLR